MRASDFLLLREIPCVELGLTIHNPSIEEISMVGETSFFKGLRVLTFSKKDLSGLLSEELLDDATDFSLLMFIINTQENAHFRKDVEKVFQLIFPNYQILIKTDSILISDVEKKTMTFLREGNFAEFVEIIKVVFDLKNQKDDEFNPANKATEKLIEQIKRGREKIKREKEAFKDKKDENVLANLVSIMSVGMGIDINVLKKYTVIQLLNAFERYQLKLASDRYFMAKVQGAEGLDEPEDWYKSL